MKGFWKQVSASFWVIVICVVAIVTKFCEWATNKADGVLFWSCGKLRSGHPEVADYWLYLINERKLER